MRCRVCHHAERVAIEAACTTKSVSDVAAIHGLSERALDGHLATHPRAPAPARARAASSVEEPPATSRSPARPAGRVATLARSPRRSLRVVDPTATATLAIVLGEDSAPPKEFRLFVAGWNETENGSFLFDAQAAAATVAAYEAWGVDLMIDLEHQSLEPETPPEPTAKDARGWCQLELRDDGSLWAVNVSWTADGTARLTEKRQRYVSPAFGYDKESRRVTKILNVAITAIPATHDTPSLMAARVARDFRKLSTGPAFSDVQIAINAALAERFPAPPGDCFRDGPWVADVFDATVVYQFEGSLYEVAYTFDGSSATLADAPVEVNRSYTPVAAPAAPPAAAAPAAPAAPAPAPPIAANRKQRTATLAASGGDDMDKALVTQAMEALVKDDAKAAMEILKKMMVSAAGGEAEPAGDKPADAPGEKPADKPADKPPAAPAAANGGAPEEEEKKEPMMAAARVALALTGRADPGEAMAELARRSAVAVDLETREAKLTADRLTLEAGERRALVGKLVKLGVEIPATAWSDDKGTIPVARLAAEPIAELRARVAKLSAVPGRAARGVTPPAGTDGTELTPREIAICAKQKIDPAKYAATRAGIRARNTNVQGA